MRARRPSAKSSYPTSAPWHWSVSDITDPMEYENYNYFQGGTHSQMGRPGLGLLFSFISLSLLSSSTTTHLCFCELLDVQPIITRNRCSSKHFVLHHLLSDDTWADLTAWVNLVVKQTTVAYWLSIWHTCFLASIKISINAIFSVYLFYSEPHLKDERDKEGKREQGHERFSVETFFFFLQIKREQEQAMRRGDRAAWCFQGADAVAPGVNTARFVFVFLSCPQMYKYWV